VKILIAPGRETTHTHDDEWLLSQHRACVECGVSYPEPTPSLFSFNSPNGACEACGGLGVVETYDPQRIIPDPDLSLAGGAIEPWQRGAGASYYTSLQAALAEYYDVALDRPWKKLPARARNGILHGKGAPEIELPRALWAHRRTRKISKRKWLGVIDELERRAEHDERAGRALARYRVPHECGDCGGARLRLEARHVKLGPYALHELSALSIKELCGVFETLPLTSLQRTVADRILQEIGERLQFLVDVGLEYLSLDRPSATLAGGEAQRIRLATQIGSRLMGVLYILDEPSIGLHARDNDRLIESLLQLRDIGNSVIVVEHDESTMRAADHIIDMGPGAGVHGGAIVAQGSADDLCANPDSLTGAYLSGARRVTASRRTRRSPGGPSLQLRGCKANNLKNVGLEIPLGLFTVVTGVSGSGKSSLINDTLHRALAAKLHGALQVPGPFSQLSGLELIDKVIDVDQSPIGRSPRSNPATYSGALSGIRNLFAQVPEARVRGYGPGRFSFNVKGGRCDACEGDGVLRVEMHFLPDIFVPCEICAGRRYNTETLEIRYADRTIADVMEMTVEEALSFMTNVPAVRRPLEALSNVGLGYLHLGQAATTLSGGEAQRVKLAKELARRSTGRTLYLLDEPTTGLHFADVEKLLEMLTGLVEKGNTVVVIEHQLDVVYAADHIIDLGPEGGDAGGEIVVTGTPEEVVRCARSHTGRALAQHLEATAPVRGRDRYRVHRGRPDDRLRGGGRIGDDPDPRSAR